MIFRSIKLALTVFLSSYFSYAYSADGVAQSLSKDDSRVYIVSPKNNDIVENPITVIFGLDNMEISPAGIKKKFSGHHHLLIDVKTLPDLSMPIPADENHMHFGKGQTSVVIELKKGIHTLQLLMGDYVHIPHNKPVYSEKIIINVQ
tara:strand:- start:32 stop:472 length:441 start_codon:yes stop_codon:yes gene_type:complete